MNPIFKNIESIALDLTQFYIHFPDDSAAKENFKEALMKISFSSSELLRLSIPISPTEQKEIRVIIDQTKYSIHVRQEKQILHNANQLASYLSSKIQGRN
jgi:hypothetical protein